MLDIAWPELVVIGAVALVAIGPKDLPKAMRVLGQWAGKARRAMHDIQQQFEQLNYEAEIAEKLKNEPPPASPPDPDRDRTA
ncbi:MAG: Sec-independent protein translocase protein TatB [Bdellovibrionales bacterium]